jgi:hypothetical protein
MTQSGTATQTPRPGFKISSKTGREYRVHGTQDKDPRGSSRDRKIRRAWLVSVAAGFGGNGVSVPCVHCKIEVTTADMHVDRIIPGGSYRRINIQPSCGSCNLARGNKVNWTPKVTGPFAF